MAEKQAFTTRRQFERFQSDMAIWVRRSETDEEFALVEISNISAGGLLFFIDHQLESKSILEIRFELPQISDLVESKAEVRHCAAFPEEDGIFSVGVSFTEVKNFSIPVLIAYLEALFT